MVGINSKEGNIIKKIHYNQDIEHQQSELLTYQNQGIYDTNHG